MIETEKNKRYKIVFIIDSRKYKKAITYRKSDHDSLFESAAIST